MSGPGGERWATCGLPCGGTHHAPAGMSAPMAQNGEAVSTPVSETGNTLQQGAAGAPGILQQGVPETRNPAIHASDGSRISVPAGRELGCSSQLIRARASAGAAGEAAERQESEQEAGDRDLALRIHAEEVAAEAVRRKRAREAFLADVPPCGKNAGASRKRIKRGPLDMFLRKPS